MEYRHKEHQKIVFYEKRNLSMGDNSQWQDDARSLARQGWLIHSIFKQDIEWFKNDGITIVYQRNPLWWKRLEFLEEAGAEFEKQKEENKALDDEVTGWLDE